MKALAITKKKRLATRGVSVLPKVVPNLKDKATKQNKDRKEIVKILSLGDSEGMLLFDIHLGDECVTALFDTGAEVSLVHSEVLKELNISYKRVEKSVHWGDGSFLRYKGEVNLTFNIGEVRTSFVFLVVETCGLPCRMLIGNDFADAHMVIYTSRPTTLPINGQEVKVLRSNNKSAVSMATVGLKGH